MEQRSAFATPRSSQQLMPGWFGSPQTVRTAPSPTSLPKGLRWLQGVGSFFRPNGEGQATGSLLAPIVNMTSSGYGSIATGSVQAPSGPNQQFAIVSGSMRQAPISFEGMAMSPFPLGATGQPGRDGNAPPSSHSSLPHDAIQAEVSRQLEGLMYRVRAAEQENQLLRNRLEAGAPDGRRIPQPTQFPMMPEPAPSSPSVNQQVIPGLNVSLAALAAMPPAQQGQLLYDALLPLVRALDDESHAGIIVDVLLQGQGMDVIAMLSDTTVLARNVAADQDQLGLVASAGLREHQVSSPSHAPITVGATQQEVTSSAKEAKGSWVTSVSGMLADLMATVQASGRVENQGVSGFPLQSDSSQAPLPAGLPVSFTPLQGGLHERQTTTQSHQPCEAATLQGGVVGNGQGSGAATLSRGVGSSLFGASTSHVPFPQINSTPEPTGNTCRSSPSFGRTSPASSCTGFSFSDYCKVY